MRQPAMTLVRITNPNPRTLCVWRGAVLQDTILSKHTLATPITSDLKLSYPGKAALVALQIEGDEVTDQEWIQRVGQDPVHVHPDFAYKPEEHRA